MKRPWFILISGLALAVLAFTCVYSCATATPRSWERGSEPELAWFKEEFKLTEAQYASIVELHQVYRPKCMEMCRRIDEKNRRLRTLLAGASEVTPEVKRTLNEAAQLRAECEAAMLDHFYQVSRIMPPGQGQRYLSWVQEETLVPGKMVPMRPAQTSPPRTAP